LDEKGQVRYLQQFPQVATARHLMNTLCRLQAELGLTPAGRSRIHVTPSSGPDALDRLLSKRNHRSA
jgi:phage terminase small subunit